MQNTSLAKATSTDIKELKEGSLVEINKIVKKGLVKLYGIIIELKDQKAVVETKDDEITYNIQDLKTVEATTQPKKGFNKNKTKLTEQAVKDIYFMATTTKLSHKHIVSWVKLHYNIEIVPKTVSDIKLGKRWGHLNLTEKGA